MTLYQDHILGWFWFFLTLGMGTGAVIGTQSTYWSCNRPDTFLKHTLSHPGRIIVVPVNAEYRDGDVQVLVLVVHPREPEKSNRYESHLRSLSRFIHALALQWTRRRRITLLVSWRTCCSRSWRPGRWWSRTGSVYRPCSSSSSPPCSCTELYVKACFHGRDLHPATPSPPDTQGTQCMCVLFNCTDLFSFIVKGVAWVKLITDMQFFASVYQRLTTLTKYHHVLHLFLF